MVLRRAARDRRAGHGDGPSPARRSALEPWAAFSSKDLLDRSSTERMLAGVATRRQPRCGRAGRHRDRASDRVGSKSAVSRRFVAATEKALAELMARNLSELDLAVL